MQFYLLNPGPLGELSYYAKGNRPGEFSCLPSSSQYGGRNIPGITAIWGTECHSVIPQLLVEHLLWVRRYYTIRKMGKHLCQQGARDLTSNTVGEMKLSSGSNVPTLAARQNHLESFSAIPTPSPEVEVSGVWREVQALVF